MIDKTVANSLGNTHYQSANEMIEIITKLAELRDLGVLTESVFNTKKQNYYNKISLTNQFMLSGDSQKKPRIIKLSNSLIILT